MVVGLVGALCPAAAWSGPRDDPWARGVERLCRLEGLDCVLGASDHSRLRQAERLLLRSPVDGPDPLGDALDLDLDPELVAARGDARWLAPPWRLLPLGAVSVGNLVPDYLGGDEEPGLLSLRAGGEGRAYPGLLELSVAAEGRLDLAGQPVSGGLGVREAWAGVAWKGVVAGFGLRDRHVGPGHRGSLMLTDNAAPTPFGSLAGTSAADQRFGRVHAELGAGWIPGPRTDVANPGWLLMDLRYLPVPELELGATRVGIFGGQGRPLPSVGQLLLPTDPHVYDDPDQVEPDQDEMAALDIRTTLPVGRWTGRGSRRDAVTGIDFVELWWQYGAEDIIALDLGGVPYPSLAGVANLFGAELVAGPLGLSFEGARILDDYFRWYTGHRVYHDGFTHLDRVMAHAAGGDALSWWGALSWEPGPWGVELSAEHRVRVGVVESLGQNLMALATDERRTRVGVSGWRLTSLGWWKLTVEGERVTGVDFVPGRASWGGRVAIGR